MRKKIIDKEKFIECYLIKGYSTRDLAKEFDISQTTARRRLQEWNVPTRTPEQSKKTDKFKEKHTENSKKLEKNITKTCPNCDKKFNTKPHINAKFCSRECYLAYTSKSSYTEVECTQCGKIYLTKNRNLQYENKFCSYKCQGEYKSLHFRGENSHSYNRIQRFCGYCGKVLLVPKHKDNYEKIYCDMNCMSKDYKIRMRGENNPHWMGGKRKYYGANWLSQRDLCREKYNYTCQRCGVSEERLGHQLSVHHIKLFRLHESSEEANILNNLISLCPACHTFVHSNKNINKEFLNI